MHGKFDFILWQSVSEKGEIVINILKCCQFIYNCLIYYHNLLIWNFLLEFVNIQAAAATTATATTTLV
jgi:hypothetical protein